MKDFIMFLSGNVHFVMTLAIFLNLTTKTYIGLEKQKFVLWINVSSVVRKVARRAYPSNPVHEHTNNSVCIGLVYCDVRDVYTSATAPQVVKGITGVR